MPLSLDLEAWVSEGADTKEVTLHKISFPEKIRNNTIAILNNMNINNLSLFPDLVGASKTLEIALKRLPLFQTTQL